MAHYIPLSSGLPDSTAMEQPADFPYRVEYPRAEVVRIRISRGVKIQDCDVYIGGEVKRGGWNLEASIWANPYTPWNCDSLEQALALYETYVRKNLWDRLIELKGKRLGCWCKPMPCHGDVLIKLLDEYLKRNYAEEYPPLERL